MVTTKGWQLSQLTILHIDFIVRLIDDGTVTETEGVELVEKGLEELVKDAKDVIFPINREIIGLVSQHFRSGRRKIAIYRDTHDQRYVAADFLDEGVKPVETDITNVMLPSMKPKDSQYKQLYLPFTGYQ